MNRSTQGLEGFEQLLNDFQSLPKLRQAPKTLLQVAGFPHWEIVCSNILAFFFDRHDQHGLDDLFLKSLLQVSGSKFADHDFPFVETAREAETNEGKQIDILIVAKPILVVIENKIRARVSNPLDIYGRHAEERADAEGVPRENIVKIILSVRAENYAARDGFKQITYDKLFRQILKNLGPYAPGCEQRYLTFLLDFMNTIKNEQKEAEFDDQLCRFLRQNEQRQSSTIRFYATLTRFRKQLRSRIKSLSARIRVPGDFRSYYWCSLDQEDEKKQEKQVYDSIQFKRTLADGTKITACLWIGLAGWKVEWWTDSEKPAKWSKAKGIPEPVQFGLDELDENVAVECTKLLNAIAKLS